MTKNSLILAAVAAIIASSASAQSLIGRDTVAGDRNDDLIEAIEDDAERELDRFGNEGRPQGFTGSVALRGVMQTGNTESTTIGIGTDMNYVFGPRMQRFGLATRHSKRSSRNGQRCCKTGQSGRLSWPPVKGGRRQNNLL